MPRGDGTGPMGMGAMTGRRAGYCAGFGMPGYANRGFGAGFGRGRGFGMGFGRGWRNRFWAAGAPGWYGYGVQPLPYGEPNPEAEKQALKSQAEVLQSELEMIKKRLAEVESAAAEK